MKRLGVLCLTLVLLAGAYFWGRASAAGVPATKPLFYSGYLTDSGGAPASGNHGFIIKLYPDMTTTADACTFAVAAPVTGGRFRLQLDDTCTAAVHQNSDLYLELTIDTQPFPRSKLGAVPYALEAANASAVPFGGVTGITANSEWPGTVSPERVLGGTTHGWVRSTDPAGTSLMAAYIQGTTTPTISSQTGSWINNVTFGGTGTFTVGFAFASRPWCAVTSDYGGATGALTSLTSTGATVLMTVGGAPQNTGFLIICAGR